MNKFKYCIWGFVCLLGMTFLWSGCEDPNYEERTNFEVLIGEYFDARPDSFSLFSEILERSQTVAFLKAYGNYTCFAPTNVAVQAYLKSKNVSSVSEIDPLELKQLVRYCVVNDTVPSEMFVDGRLEYPSMQGQYMITGTTVSASGEVMTLVNRQAAIVKKDLRVTNGIIHVIDQVLTPSELSISDYLAANPEFSYFWQAMQETGFDKILDTIPSADKADTTWYTIFSVPDAVYNASGITSFEALKATYDSQPDEKGLTGLYKYMAYHVLKGQQSFVSDLITAKVAKTMAPGEVLTVKNSGTTVLINDDIFAGVHEPGFEIQREVSDLCIGNGVVHVMKGNFAVKERFPFPVYWEVTDMLEIKKMPGVYKKAYQNLTHGQLADVTWEPTTASIGYVAPFTVSGTRHCVNDDVFEIYLRPEVVKSITFKTPTLVKGSYKIWIASRNVPTSSRMPKFYVYFNDKSTSRIMDCAKAPGLSDGKAPTDAELNLNNFKIYQYNPYDWYTTDETAIQTNIDNGTKLNWLGSNAWGRVACQYAGTVVVEETGSQTLKFEAISGGSNSYLWLDQIQFIPVEEDQNWPRINTLDASYVYKEDLLMGNFPKTN
ncbi:putative surface protein with fasciclin (FAS1) repeats [Breznakibacter xylanolyticus]|uniref:Putative surface protein with fasciclin (FAS1) repeats n=1 Tax=Breznakibacter xylanolyticus TaxID=990 RepID=A0A2W7NKL0_9BACT|nr:fasciclin domain-containing protein [Breznakibacter xylanolyticus]PZX18627.1 putative surface protein with fasciclin (FAS1) repeats [Breznakibacter xylanolyticus]